jgi:hypothetical protein
MTTVPGIAVFLALILGMVYMVLSMVILHSYESETQQRPPSFQFWAFDKEMREKYPTASRAGQILELASVGLIGIWGLWSLAS